MKRVTSSATCKESTVLTVVGDEDKPFSGAGPAAAIDEPEENGKGSSSCQTITNPPTNPTIAPANPLLMEDYLEKLFPYFEDQETLKLIRLVCKTWNHSSAPTVKRNLRWRVERVVPNETGEEFLQTMAETSLGESSRLFRNFRLEPSIYERSHTIGEDVDRVNTLLKKFGSHMIDLQIESRDINYVREHLKQTFLTNLEQLKFYGMSREVLVDRTLFENSPPLPKVKSLRFYPWICWPYCECDEELEEGEGRICFNILKACPNLRELELNLKKTCLNVLRDVKSELNLASLTSFKNKLRDRKYMCGCPAIVVLGSQDLANLVNKCPHLKVLSINIDDRTSKAEISQMLSKYSAQLEELYVSLNANGRTYPNSDDEVEVDDAPARYENVNAKKRRIPFPDFPLLKKLAIFSWFYNDFNNLGSMPLLKEIDLRLRKDMPLDLSSPQTVSYPCVTKLRFQCVLKRCTYWFEEFERDECLKSPMVGPLISIFPNVTELYIELADDEALRNLFRALAGCGGGQLKRLHLNRSRISDDGMTGIEWTEELKDAHNTLSSSEAIVVAHRKFPFIGDLEGLQEFTCAAYGLTNLSIQYGLISLTGLTSLQFPPFHDGSESSQDNSHEIWSSLYERKENKVTLVNVRLLVDNLPNLIKLDVNDEDDGEGGPNSSARESGCGINDADLEYLKQHHPSLQVIYYSERYYGYL